METYYVSAVFPDAEGVTRRRFEDSGGAVESRRVRRRVPVLELDGGPVRGDKSGTGFGRVAEEDPVEESCVGGGATVEEVVVRGSEGGLNDGIQEERESREKREKVEVHNNLFLLLLLLH